MAKLANNSDDRLRQQFLIEQVRPDVIQYPQLLIGCGGTGCDVVRRIVQLWNPNWALRIVLVDSDSTALNDTATALVEELNVPQGNISTIHLQGAMVLRALEDPQMNERVYMPILKSGGIARQDSNTGKWIVDYDLANQAVTHLNDVEAAQQTPSYSRMMFYAERDTISTNISLIIENLLTIRDDLIDNDAGRVRQAARVAVFASAFGGTGAGIVLPIMFAVKDQHEVNLSLYLFDSSFARDEYFGTNEAFRRRANMNEIVCERELDIVLQGLQMTTDDQGRRTGDYLLPELTERNGRDPARYKYDRVFLINRNVYGGKERNIDYEAAKSSVARAFVELSRLQRNGALGGIDQDPYEKNWPEYLCETTRARRKYCSLASSTLKYPRQDVIRYLAYASVGQLYRLAMNMSAPQEQAPRATFFDSLENTFSALKDKVEASTRTYKDERTLKRFKLSKFDELERTLTNTAKSLEDQLYKTGVEPALDEYCKNLRESLKRVYACSLASGDAFLQNVSKVNRDTLNRLNQILQEIPRRASLDSLNLARENVSRKVDSRKAFLGALEKRLICSAKERVLNKVKTALEQFVNTDLRNMTAWSEQRKRIFDDIYRNICDSVEKKRSALLADSSLVTSQWLEGRQKNGNELFELLGISELEEQLSGCLTGMRRLNEAKGDDVARANVNYIFDLFRQRYDEIVPRNVVALLLEMEQQDREKIIRKSYLKASPLYDCENHHGMATHSPISRCFCIVPTLPQGEERYPREFEACFTPQSLQLANAESAGASIVPCSENQDELTFVHIITGLRPNYSRDFSDKKIVFRRAKETRRLGIIPTPIERLNWYNDNEKNKFKGNDQFHGRDPDSDICL
ncbi:MAG: hypothetical protein IJL92_06350 [Thermoguttaceae bacterium]|nr:hypothetical protein [Thermoguttaceae bacterium]